MARSGRRKIATLSDVAATVGVAPMTVSRVVNGNGYVSDEMREKVMEAVRKMNYRRNGLARSLKRQKTDTVGLVIGDISNPYSTELANAVRESLSSRGYNLFICISEHSAKEDISAFDSLVDHHVDGLIVATRANKEGNSRLADIASHDIPIVLIGRDLKHESIDSVSADNFTGGYEATQHLIDLGHKRIGFLGASFEDRGTLKRLQGYISALTKHKIPVDERLITGRKSSVSDSPGYSTETVGYEGMKRLLSLPKRPTAIFARNDFTALGAMTAIKEADLSIPKDIAIVGFDDTPMATHTLPPLTTVRQPMRLQGQIAAEMLLRRIAGEEAEAKETRMLDCDLIIRGSTVAS